MISLKRYREPHKVLNHVVGFAGGWLDALNYQSSHDDTQRKGVKADHIRIFSSIKSNKSVAISFFTFKRLILTL